jgi:taurine dioxygenase
MVYDLGRYKRITVEPLTGSIGAEIFGVDVSSLDQPTFDEIRQAFLEHHVIVFRDQELGPQSLSDFAERFAPLTVVPHAKPLEGDGLVIRFTRDAEVPRTERNLGDQWHSDQSPREFPNSAAALYCLEAPAYGGDTQFANLCMAYDTLSPAMQALCRGLIGLHSRAGIHGRDGMGKEGLQVPLFAKGTEGGYNPTRLDDETLAYINDVMEHPLVCTHPESGKAILYVTGPYITGFKGMSDLESRPLIDQLNRHAHRPEFTCRVRWRKGSLTVWDNRCTQHYAVNDYAGFNRKMLRIEMEGGRPYGPATPRPQERARAKATAA